MTNISPRSIARYLAVAALALAIPLTVVANSAGSREAGGGGHCGATEGRGPMGKKGGEMGPHYLRGLNLTEAQRDKVFEVMHAQAPSMREKAKLHRGAEEDLRKLVAAPDFSEAEARAQVDALGKSVAEMALTRVKADRQIFAILTPEQRQQLAETRPAGAGRRRSDEAAHGNERQ